MSIELLHSKPFCQVCIEVLGMHVINSTTMIVIEIDRQGRIIAANPAFNLCVPDIDAIYGQSVAHFINGVTEQWDIPMLWDQKNNYHFFKAHVADYTYIIHAHCVDDHAVLIGELIDETRKDAATIELMGKITFGMSNLVRELRKTNEELFEARKSAEAANHAKSAFLAAMSHEIRTPMNGVIGLIDLLKLSPLNADQQAMVTTIKDSAFTLLSIIDEILDFSKIEANKLTLEHTPVSLKQIVEGVGNTLQPLAQRKQLRLDYYCDPALPEWVSADAVRLRQILFNLAGNAVKFTPSEPPQTGQVNLQALCTQSDDQHCEVHFQVKDTGIGIAPEMLPKLFQPFTQAEDSTTRRFGGTGLGLSICARLVEMMGGTIHVESQLGQGSTFNVYLRFQPLCEQSAQQTTPESKVSKVPSQAPSIEEARARGQLILVAEDNPTNQTVLSYQLKALGYVAEMTNDGLEALDRLRRGSYALLLTDYQMPNLDGLALTAAIREMERYTTRRLPIIILTANAVKGEAERFLEAGANDVLTKPVMLEDMRRLLARWIPLSGTEHSV